MRYMLLIHHDEAALAAADQKALWGEYAAFNEALQKAGQPGERLQPSSAATTIRRRDGKAEVLDGPYADTKEQFAGYFIIDARDLDEAISWAEGAIPHLALVPALVPLQARSPPVGIM